MKRYLNMQSNQGRETVDELNSNDFKSWKEFRAELNRLICEYQIAGMNVYRSSRMCSNWRD